MNHGVVLIIVGALLSPIAARAQIVWPITPRDRPHAFDHSIGGYQGQNGWHGGLDIPAPPGTDVFSVIDGTVRTLRRFPCGDENKDGEITISGDTGTWRILHICDIPAELTIGAAVTTATRIGDVVRYVVDPASGIADHVHIQKISPSAPDAPIANPLAELARLPQRVPVIDNIRFRFDGTTEVFAETVRVREAIVIDGAVDIAVHATTTVADETTMIANRAEINAIGYRADGRLDVQGRGVPERFLFDFTVPAANFQDTEKLGLAYDQVALTFPGIPLFYFNWFIVTNCGALTAEQIRASGDAIVNVRSNAWRTKAYLDGYYDVVITGRAFGGNQTTLTQAVYVNNRMQEIKTDKDSYVTSEVVNVSGTGFIPGMRYTIYFVPREKLNEVLADGLPMPPPPTYSVAETTITANLSGALPETELWSFYTRNIVDKIDIGYHAVVDYDKDGFYHTARRGVTVDATYAVAGGTGHGGR